MSTFPDGLFEYGGVPVGMSILQPKYVYWAYASTSAQYYIELSKNPNLNLYSTINSAEAAVTSARNDVVFVTPETHTLSAALTWDSSNTHLIGMHSGSPWANNAMIQQTGSTAQSPAITVSGSDNYFANLHFRMSGTHVDQHVMLRNSGSGNHYENCWFEGPRDSTQAQDTNVELVQVTGGGNYFHNCMFTNSASSTYGAKLLGFYSSAYRTTFDNCVFYQQTGNQTATRFIDLSAGADISGPQFFRHCIFHAWAPDQTTKATYLIETTGVSLTTGQLHFQDCSVVGFTDIVASGCAMGVFMSPQLTAAPDGTYAGLVVACIT